jgi:hypothetical protein
MDEERNKEIAYRYLRNKMLKEGQESPTARELVAMSSEIGWDVREVCSLLAQLFLNPCIEPSAADFAKAGALAHAYIRHRVSKKGYEINKNSVRYINGAAKAIGIPAEELMQYMRDVIVSLLDEHMPVTTPIQ